MHEPFINNNNNNICQHLGRQFQCFISELNLLIVTVIVSDWLRSSLRIRYGSISGTTLSYEQFLGLSTYSQNVS